MKLTKISAIRRKELRQAAFKVLQQEGMIHARMRSNLMSALIHLLPRAECEAVALTITTLIDGLWLRAGLQSKGLSRDIALAQMRDYLDHRLPRLDKPIKARGENAENR